VRNRFWRVPSVLPRRQVTLFLLAIVVPSVVLILMAAWMTAQDRELAQKRAADEHQRQTEDIRQSLLRYLEGHKAAQMSAGLDGWPVPALPVVLVARIADDRLVLPWDDAASPAAVGGAEPLAAAIRDGEHHELVALQPLEAAKQYSRAVALARDEGQRAYARLLLARAWTKARHHDRARAEYVRLVDLAPGVRDEHGVPMWTYAAQRLAATGDAPIRSTISAKIARDVEAIDRTAPAARYLLRDLLERAAPAGSPEAATVAIGRLRDRLDQSIQSAEQAAALQRAFPLDGLRETAAPAPRWVLFGEPSWLVSTASSTVPWLVAIPAQAALDAVITARVSDLRLLPGESAEGEWLGQGFAGMKVAYVPVIRDEWARRWPVQRWFTWLIVLLSLSVTSFGAYFLWRDVQREVRMAALKSQFVSSVSHELKTPLTAIRMFAETLRMGRASDEATAAEYLDTIVNESERLTRLLNNVLEFSKMERGATHFRLQATPLRDPIQRVIRAMSYPLEQQGFRLHVAISDPLPRVLIDPDAIEQALLNLVANAMKYSGEARDIALHVTAAGGAVEIAVTDHGIGIADTDQPRVFEKFYRAPTPENRHIPGTGLGLTLVDHIARAHGGRVHLTSAPGRGSTFSLVLPAAAVADGAAPSLAHLDAV
jgi:signal transduction histidine kinase